MADEDGGPSAREFLDYYCAVRKIVRRDLVAHIKRQVLVSLVIAVLTGVIAWQSGAGWSTLLLALGGAGLYILLAAGGYALRAPVLLNSEAMTLLVDARVERDQASAAAVQQEEEAHIEPHLAFEFWTGWHLGGGALKVTNKSARPDDFRVLGQIAGEHEEEYLTWNGTDGPTIENLLPEAFGIVMLPYTRERLPWSVRLRFLTREQGQCERRYQVRDLLGNREIKWAGDQWPQQDASWRAEVQAVLDVVTQANADLDELVPNDEQGAKRIWDRVITAAHPTQAVGDRAVRPGLNLEGHQWVSGCKKFGRRLEANLRAALRGEEP